MTKLYAALVLSFVFTALQGLSHQNLVSGSFYSYIMQMHDQTNETVTFNTITIKSDVPFSSEEFSYVTGITENTDLRIKDVKHGIQRLVITKKFSHIDLSFAQEGHKKNLLVTLSGAFIVKKISVHGVWFGKASYTSLYSLQPGEPFETQTHEHSVETIKKHLIDEGYLQAKVSDEIEYQEKDKTVTVKLTIKKGRVFFIKSAQLKIEDLSEQKKHTGNDDLDTIIATIEKKYITHIEGFKYSKRFIQKITRRIKKDLAAEGFPTAKINIKRLKQNKMHDLRIALCVKLGRRKIITTEGNTVFSQEAIRQQLFTDESPDWLFSADILSQHLKHDYYKKGFWKAGITSIPLGDIGYKFIIKEGPPTIIHNVEAVLAKTGIHENVERFFTKMEGAIFDKELFEQSVESMKTHYLSHGFWDFKIISEDFVKITGKQAVTINLVIEKGPQRYWAGMNIPGFKDLQAHSFFKKFSKPPKGKRIPFDITWIVEQRSYILDYLQNQGYWYAEVEPELTIIPDTTLSEKATGEKIYVFVSWKIKQGKQVRFDRPIITGCSKASYQKILQHIPIKEGELWDRKKINLARKRLKQLDVFKVASVQSPQLSSHKSKKPVVVTVVDEDPLEIRLRLGYFFNSSNLLFKNQNTPKIGSSFIIKNPTAQADKITLTGDWSLFERKGLIDYQQPSPFNVNVVANVNAYASKFIHPVQILGSGSAYEAELLGLSARVSDHFNDHYQWHISIGNEWTKITKVEGALNFAPELVGKMLPSFFIQPNLTIDFLDDKINTTRGWITHIETKFAVPEKRGQAFAKVILEQSLFYPIIGNVVLAGRIRAGHIFSQDFNKILPTERFFLGGPNSVRGYEPEALPPLGTEEKIIDGASKKIYTIQGGSTMLNGNIELRIPVYNAFGVTLFQDVGILSQSGFLGLKERWYPGSGFGLRYKTPIGAIRFDIGWKWKRRLKEDQRPYAWYLTLSEAF